MNNTGTNGEDEAGSPQMHRKVRTPNAVDGFRAELLKVMPGYSWTVHRASKGAAWLIATGIQSSGFNRLSTLRVGRKIEGERPWYTARSAGYGTRAPLGIEVGDVTLARALRGLQEHYERKCNSYRVLAGNLQKARFTKQVPA